MAAIDDGTNSDYATNGGAPIPIFHAGPLDRKPSIKGGPYSHGVSGVRGQFGIMEVIDDGGDNICIEWKVKTLKVNLLEILMVIFLNMIFVLKLEINNN